MCNCTHCSFSHNDENWSVFFPFSPFVICDFFCTFLFVSSLQMVFAKWKCCLALMVIFWNNIAGCNNIPWEISHYFWKCVFCTRLGNMSKFFAALNVVLCFCVISIMLQQQQVATLCQIFNTFFNLHLKMLLPPVYVKQRCPELQNDWKCLAVVGEQFFFFFYTAFRS